MSYSELQEAEESELNLPFINNMLSRFSNPNATDSNTHNNHNNTNNNTNNKNIPRNQPIIKELSLKLRNKSNTNPNLIKNFENISKDLIKMGFQPNMVLNSFLALQYETIEDAIEIMSKNSNDLWNHKFFAGEDELCFICDQMPSAHVGMTVVSTGITGINDNISLLVKKKSSGPQQAPVPVPVPVYNKGETVLTVVNNGDGDVIKINVNSCEICFMEILQDQKYNLNCKHEFCKECIIEYLKEEIKNARVESISCPDKECKEIFNDSQIKSLVAEEIYYKYQKFIQRCNIRDDNNLIVCPIVNCEGFAKRVEGDDNKSDKSDGSQNSNNEIDNRLIIEDNNQNENNDNNDSNHNQIRIDLNDNQNKEINMDHIININNPTEQNQKIQPQNNKPIKLTCNNGHNFCSNCNKAWHNDSSCDDDSDIKDFATYSGYIVKKCPKCKTWTEKNEGCNHMTCKICEYDWCWLCELECLPNHFNVEGTPCYGKMFNHTAVNNNYMMIEALGNNFMLDRYFFTMYAYTYIILNMAVMQAYHRPPEDENNRNNNRVRPSKISFFIAMSCINLCILSICLVFNAFILLAQIVNVSRLADVNSKCGKLVCLLTYLVIYCITYISIGPVLSLMWFGLTSLYLMYLLIKA